MYIVHVYVRYGNPSPLDVDIFYLKEYLSNANEVTEERQPWNWLNDNVRSDIGPRWQAWLTIVDRFLVLFEIRVARYFPIPPLEKES